MNRLYLDSSGNLINLGIENIEEGLNSLKFKSFSPDKGLCEDLPVFLNELCSLSNIKNRKLSSVSEIVCISGPGSFTGLRTGIAFCEGISFSNGAIIFGISLFLARGFAIFNNIESSSSNKTIMTLSLSANSSEDFICQIIFERNENVTNFQSGEIITANKELIKNYIPEDSLYFSIDKLERSTNSVQDLAVLFNKLNPEANFPKNTQHFKRWKSGENHSDLLYVKGASAKTLKERGIELQNNEF